MTKIGVPPPQKTGPFIGPTTFMNIPYSTDFSEARAVVLGVPYDGGLHPTRIGSRTGPAAIREQSQLVRPFQPPHTRFNPLELLNVVDCGDADTTPSIIEDSFREIEEAAHEILAADAVPLAFGGDGNITLPLLRAARKFHPDLVVLHVDAHTDTYRGDGNQDYMRYNVSTTFTRAAEEGLIDTAASLHVGARGTTNDSGVFEHTRDVGFQLIDGDELFEIGLNKTAETLTKQLKDRTVYLCFDMDFFDPSCAPGVCTPTWGGATAREGLGFLRRLHGLNIVGADINTVSPPHDVGGMTAFLASAVALEILTLFCHAQGLVPQEPEQ
jgi:agmatinase